MTQDPNQSHDAQTTPVGAPTSCPQCGVQLDSLTTSCGACGAVITGGAMDAERMERVRVRLQEGIGQGYKLGDMLGRGGMGIVFSARELTLDRDVALKVLAFDPILNPDAYARFEREARLAARLDHPNIVPIFAVGQGNGIAFYTMRMVRGGSVEAMVGPGRPLEMKQALSILGDVAAALDYAHAQGVVHRDIKPANVLLGDSGHAMVADFGIARAVTGPGGGTTATGTGVVGSPAYMSPEQWRGEKVDGRADQYALGVLAFELFTGVRPFKGNSMQELLRMHLSDDAPDIISVRHDLPSHLTDTIRRALAKDPDDRFPSSAAFVAALGGAPAPSKRAAAVAPISSAPTVRTPVPPLPVGVGARTVAKGAPLANESQKVPVGATAGGESRERRSLVPWLALLLIAGAGAAVIWKLAPDRGSSAAAPTQFAAADSMGDLEKRLQAQVDEMRRIAMAAERRADSIAAANSANRGSGAPSGGGAQSPAPREDPHAHVYVFAQGGTPQVFVDGVSQNTNAPAVFQLTPGRHVVSVRGGQEFAPAETTIVLAPEDTQTVVFRVSRTTGVQQQNFPAGRVGQQFRNAGTQGPIAAAAPVGTNVPAGLSESILTPGPNGQPLINWPAVTKKLGFDPRTVDQRTMTPIQRQNYRKFQYMLDSLRRAGAAGGLRKP
jgi:serine/threonine protein kinase